MSYILSIKLDTSQLSNEQIEHYLKFKSHHDGDAGIDLINTEYKIADILAVETIDFKIQCEMRDSDNNLVSYYLFPRSSISKTPFQMANSVGIIDAGYRGNIMAKVRNMSLSSAQIHKNEKWFQICAPDLKPIKISFVDKLTESSRGEGGFGSTNKK